MYYRTANLVKIDLIWYSLTSHSTMSHFGDNHFIHLPSPNEYVVTIVTKTLGG